VIHVALPSGGTALVNADVAPETLHALDRMMQAAARAFNEQINEACLTGRINATPTERQDRTTTTSTGLHSRQDQGK
jgi:hypothetical protein